MVLVKLPVKYMTGILMREVLLSEEYIFLFFTDENKYSTYGVFRSGLEHSSTRFAENCYLFTKKEINKSQRSFTICIETAEKLYNQALTERLINQIKTQVTHSQCSMIV